MRLYRHIDQCRRGGAGPSAARCRAGATGGGGDGAAGYAEAVAYDAKLLAQEVQELVDGHLHGASALLLRGLPLRTPQDFSELMQNMRYTPQPYIGGTTTRPPVAPHVFALSGESPRVCMDPHSDQAYTDTPAAKLFVFVPRPPAAGHTVLFDARRFTEEVADPARRRAVFTPQGEAQVPGDRASGEAGEEGGERAAVHARCLEELLEHGVLYTHTYPSNRTAGGARYLSWQEVLGPDRAAAESVLEGKGYAWEWVGSPCPRDHGHGSCAEHPATGSRAQGKRQLLHPAALCSPLPGGKFHTTVG